MYTGNKLDNLLQKAQSDANSGQCKERKEEDKQTVFPMGSLSHLRVERDSVHTVAYTVPSTRTKV